MRHGIRSSDSTNLWFEELRGQSHPKEHGHQLPSASWKMGAHPNSPPFSTDFLYIKADIETYFVFICFPGQLLQFALNVHRGVFQKQHLSLNTESYLAVFPDLPLKANLTAGALSYVIEIHTLSRHCKPCSLPFAEQTLTLSTTVGFHGITSKQLIALALHPAPF